MKLSKYLHDKGLKFVYICSDGEIIATSEMPTRVNRQATNYFDLFTFVDDAEFKTVVPAKSDKVDLEFGCWMEINDDCTITTFK